DAVELERLGCAATALVERGDEALPATYLLELFLVHAGDYPSWCVAGGLLPPSWPSWIPGPTYSQPHRRRLRRPPSGHPPRAAPPASCGRPERRRWRPPRYGSRWTRQ